MSRAASRLCHPVGGVSPRRDTAVNQERLTRLTISPPVTDSRPARPIAAVSGGFDGLPAMGAATSNSDATQELRTPLRHRRRLRFSRFAVRKDQVEARYDLMGRTSAVSSSRSMTSNGSSTTGVRGSRRSHLRAPRRSLRPIGEIRCLTDPSDVPVPTCRALRAVARPGARGALIQVEGDPRAVDSGVAPVALELPAVL